MINMVSTTTEGSVARSARIEHRLHARHYTELHHRWGDQHARYERCTSHGPTDALTTFLDALG
ncbi:hypothetical protein [Actinoplanes sp. NPDC026623]|uniref:hypothetical protein n=1 Tax=Actinoplanes sp. NPDC026623 TaxID=3155610 RepID=UPI0033C9C46B